MPKTSNRDSLMRGQLRLTSTATTTTSSTPYTYTKVLGTFSDGSSKNFRIENNKLIYEGCNCCTHLLNGVSDVRVNKACKLTYALYVNGELVESATTPHDFVASAKIHNISIVGLVTLNYGDELEVYCKSDTATTAVDPSTLNVTLFGSK